MLSFRVFGASSEQMRTSMFLAGADVSRPPPTFLVGIRPMSPDPPILKQHRSEIGREV
jgi:hypothetical protein